MKCRYCGAENREDYKYCLMCGKPLHEKEKGSFKPDKRIIITAAAMALLAVILWPNGGKEVFRHTATRPFIRSVESDLFVVSSLTDPSEKLTGKTSQNSYSYDKSVVASVILNDNERDLYIYYDKRFRKLASDVDSYDLSDSGEYAIYKTRSDKKWYHLTVKNGKTVEFSDGNEKNINHIALSVTGESFAFTTSDDDNLMKVFSKGKVSEHQTERIISILAVMSDDTVLFINKSYELCSFRNGKSEVLTPYPSYLFLNDDGSECAILADGKYQLYKGGKLLTSDDEYAGMIETLIYPQTMCSSYTRYYVNRKYIYCYHYGVDSFTDKYFFTHTGAIIRIDSKLRVTEIAENAFEYLVSNDGSKLVYADEFGNIFVYDGKNTKEMNTENNKASELLAYDSVNKGVYYRSTNGTYLTYADEKEVTPFFNRGSAINMTCDDGYFYFKSSSTLYFTQKGSEPVELLHCSGTSKATNDDYCSYGIILYGHDKNYYLIKNGKAVQIKSEP